MPVSYTHLDVYKRQVLGWDGLGLVCHCLVIYYQNLNSNNTGMLIALINLIGDIIILLLIK